MAPKYNQWEKAQVANYDRIMKDSVYCMICGQEILPYGGALDRYEYELKQSAHADCIKKHRMKLELERARAQQDLQNKDAED